MKCSGITDFQPKRITTHVRLKLDVPGDVSREGVRLMRSPCLLDGVRYGLTLLENI